MVHPKEWIIPKKEHWLATTEQSKTEEITV